MGCAILTPAGKALLAGSRGRLAGLWPQRVLGSDVEWQHWEVVPAIVWWRSGRSTKLPLATVS